MVTITTTSNDHYLTTSQWKILENSITTLHAQLARFLIGIEIVNGIVIP